MFLLTINLNASLNFTGVQEVSVQPQKKALRILLLYLKTFCARQFKDIHISTIKNTKPDCIFYQVHIYCINFYNTNRGDILLLFFPSLIIN